MGRNLLHSDLVYAEAAVFRKKTEDMIEENQVGLGWLWCPSVPQLYICT